MTRPSAAAGSAAASAPAPSPVRLDKWLWAARFFKTRALALEAITRNQVKVNDQVVKPSRDVRVGDRIALRQPGWVREVVVKGVSAARGPAPVAQTLYEETAESLAARAQAGEMRRFGVEPALGQPAGRPTKRDRRELVDWNRWSASLDDHNK
jgi:ribosome-associated heat shock protein Hsp15